MQSEAAVATPPQPPAQRLIAFRVGPQAYALPLESVSEVVPIPLLSHPPGLPPLFAGFFNLAGEAVAVLRLDYLFGFPSQSSSLYTPLLVVRAYRFPLALIVQSVTGIISIGCEAVLPVPESSTFNQCAQGVTLCGEEHVILLRPDRLMLKTEQQYIGELCALEESRLAALNGAGA